MHLPNIKKGEGVEGEVRMYWGLEGSRPREIGFRERGGGEGQIGGFIAALGLERSPHLLAEKGRGVGGVFRRGGTNFSWKGIRREVEKRIALEV